MSTITYGWGYGPWGYHRWGSLELGPTALEVSAINVWAADTLEVQFTTPVCNDGLLQDPETYQITPLNNGQSIAVQSVRSGTDPSTLHVFLIVTVPTFGETYRVTIVGDITAASGAAAEAGTYGEFQARLTKIDSFLSKQPSMYDTRPVAVLRNLMNAIGRSDDIIGGGQKENK